MTFVVNPAVETHTLYETQTVLNRLHNFPMSLADVTVELVM